MIAASGAAVSFPALSLLIILPIIGSVVVAWLSERRAEYVKLAALLTSVATGAISLWVLAAFETHDAGFQFVSRHPWIEPWGISWHLGIDGISLFLVVLTGVLFPLVIAGIDPHHDEKRYLAWLLLLEAGVMGSFLSLDLVLFFLFSGEGVFPLMAGFWSNSSNAFHNFCTASGVFFTLPSKISRGFSRSP